MKNFISNQSENTLNKRLREVIRLSRELKLLVRVRLGKRAKSASTEIVPISKLASKL